MKICKQFFALILLPLLLIFSVGAASKEESVVIVVNKNNPVASLSRSQVIDIFMGKDVSFPDGSIAIPVELEEDNYVKVTFYQQLVAMPLSSVNAYWSRLSVTERKRTTVFQESEQEIIRFILANTQAIAYLPINQVNDNLKVVYTLNE